MLPVAKNGRFLSRPDVLVKISSHFHQSDTSKYLTSMVLYGMAGVGKTQTALAYANLVMDRFDAILWIEAGNSDSIRQSFTHIACDGLSLAGAQRADKLQPADHDKNTSLVMSWLRNTSKLVSCLERPSSFAQSSQAPNGYSYSTMRTVLSKWTFSTTFGRRPNTALC
jgi:hypothetical protein